MARTDNQMNGSNNNWGWWVFGAIVVVIIIGWIAWGGYTGNRTSNTAMAPSTTTPGTTPPAGSTGTR